MRKRTRKERAPFRNFYEPYARDKRWLVEIVRSDIKRYARTEINEGGYALFGFTESRVPLYLGTHSRFFLNVKDVSKSAKSYIAALPAVVDIMGNRGFSKKTMPICFQCTGFTVFQVNIDFLRQSHAPI